MVKKLIQKTQATRLRISKADSGPYLYFFPGVGTKVIASLAALTRKLQKISEVKHYLRIEIIPDEKIIHPCGELAGIFYRDRRNRPRIIIAAGIVDFWKQYGFDSYRDAVEAINDTLCHEWVHYEQYRDKKPVIERGVSVRARNLLKHAAP